MRHSGVIYDFELDEHSWEVLEAVLTEERVAIDWMQDDDRFHLVARSQDGGRTYEGHYGIDRPDPQWEVRLTRLSTFDRDPRLFAYWLDHETGDEVQSLFELEPE